MARACRRVGWIRLDCSELALPAAKKTSACRYFYESSQDAGAFRGWLSPTQARVVPQGAAPRGAFQTLRLTSAASAVASFLAVRAGPQVQFLYFLQGREETHTPKVFGCMLIDSMSFPVAFSFFPHLLAWMVRKITQKSEPCAPLTTATLRTSFRHLVFYYYCCPLAFAPRCRDWTPSRP